jgi:dTDP-4-dehydrorhamnose reductase
MLGSALVKVFSSKGHEVVEINRRGLASLKQNSAIALDAVKATNRDSQQLSSHHFDYLINAIGLIKQLIREGDPKSETLAKAVNVKFPKWLNQFSLENNVPVIQIGTDCVFSGSKGSYSELDQFDPSDLYGETKASGESFSPEFMTIRTSIIGREISTSNSLVNWVLEQPANSEIHGYTNHLWNGVTTFAFSKIAEGIVSNNQFLKGTSHLIPRDFMTKAELVTSIAKFFHREDLVITEIETGVGFNRTLATNRPELNLKLWALGGYNKIPTITELILEYADWESSQ